MTKDLLHFLAERGHKPECTDAIGLNKEMGKGQLRLIAASTPRQIRCISAI